ncbi:hypothetical protein Cpir12675_004449 [Ceratocystis pirilliformis]|uniref:Uncharacterized protein n=1 Tax=Ceratocystis pirilliformis TaxID=259994 RepID=A0ABR3YWG7_9PEZI
MRTHSKIMQKLGENLCDNVLASLVAQPSPDDAGFGGYEPSQIEIYFGQAYPTRLNDSDNKTVGACSFRSFLLQNVVQVKDGQVVSEEVVVKIFRDTERGTFCLDFDFIARNWNPVDTCQIYQCACATRVSLDSSNLYLYTRGDNPWVIRDLRRELQATDHELNHKSPESASAQLKTTPTLLNITLTPPTDPSQVQGYLGISRDDGNAKTLGMQYKDDINNSYWASRGWVFQEQSKAATPCYGVAQRYQNKGLIVASDKLPALSGLANEFAYIMGFAESDFVAGNWRQKIITDISWEQEQPQHNPSALIKQLEASVLASQLRFPVSNNESNISWMRDASQGGDCWWMPNKETYEPCQEGVREWDVRTAIPGSNPFRAMIGGYIVLHGKLVSLSSYFEDNMYIKSQERYLLNLQYRRGSLDFISVKFDGLVGDYDIRSLCILPLLQSSVTLDLSKDLELAGLECDSNNLRGLILQRAAENGLYMRVGVFRSTSRCSLEKKCRDTNLETIELR